MTYKNAYTSEINILEQEETFGFIWPIGFQTVFCAALCVQRYLGAAKTVKKQRTNRCLDFLPYFKQNSSELFI